MTQSCLSGSHLIAGRWTKSSATFEPIEPATGKALERFSVAGEQEVNAALHAAHAAFAMQLPRGWQGDLLDAIAAAIMDLGDALLDRGERETALPRPRLTGERARAVNQLKMFAQIARRGEWVDATIDTADAQRQPAPKPDLRRMWRARGPVVVFGASNFPFAFGVCGGDTASALAAGCPVVCKGHPSHPGVNEMFATAVFAAIQKCKLPPGLFSLLQGKSHELGGMLARHPATSAIGFTGSQRAGRALFDLAAARPRPIPVYAEMGSLNPLVILPGAMREKADAIANGLAGSILLGLGQFCTKPGLIFTLGDGADAFLAALAKQISASSGGAMLNRTLRESFCQRAGEFAKAAGVKTLVNGSPTGHAGVSPSLFETTAAVWQSNRALGEEAFGPGAMVIRCRDEAEMIACLDRVEGTLTGTIHLADSDDRALVARLMRKLETLSGRVIVNGYPTGVEVCNAMVHGGPYPATTDPGWTSVGSAAIYRFARLIAFQDTPDSLLPPELQNANPMKIDRVLNGLRSTGAI